MNKSEDNWFISCNCGNSFCVNEGYEGMQVSCNKCGKRYFIPRARAAKVWAILFSVIFIVLTCDYLNQLVVGFATIGIAAIVYVTVAMWGHNS